MPPKKMERETGFEPATSTLARLHSTAELFPLINSIYLTSFILFVNFFFQNYSFQDKDFGCVILKAISLWLDQKPLETVPVVQTRPERIDKRSPQKEHADAVKVDSKIRIMNQQGDDGGDLKACFIFTQI